MDQPLDTVLELVVVEAALCLVLISFFYEREGQRNNHFRWLFGLLAVLSVFNWFNFGAFRGGGQEIHAHEQFHFYLGSKYLDELRYDAIYDATVLAGVDERILEPRERRRDPLTFKVWRSRLHRTRESEVRGRFSPERWREFRHDVAWFLKECDLDRKRLLSDHGNTGSPTWAMTAGLFTRNLPLGHGSTSVFAWLDPLLLMILFLTVWWAFGGRTLALTMIVGLSVPLVYIFLGGSILRMDWIVALGISVCFFEKRWFRTAGILLGYAVASKLLAGVMVVPLGLCFLAEVLRERKVNRDHLRYVVFALIGLVLFALLATLVFADVGIWTDYYERLLTTFQEKYYQRNHSFRDVFLQAVHHPGSIWNPWPKTIAASERAVSIDNVRPGYLAMQILLVAGLLAVAVRHAPRFAFALGPLAVFVLLVSNRYYWQMWMISALVLAPDYRRDWRHTAFLTAILGWIGAGQIVEVTRSAKRMGGYLGSWGLICIGAALLLFELIAWYRKRHTPPASSPP